jgi:hypothetical protein
VARFLVWATSAISGRACCRLRRTSPRQQSLVLPRGYPRLCQHNNADRQFWILPSPWFGSRMQFASYGEALTLPVRQTAAYLVWMAMFPAGM